MTDTERREIAGPITAETHRKLWDPISGRYHPEVNAGDYVHRVISGAVTTATANTTVSLGNFTAGSRDEVFIDLEAFGDFGGGTASTNSGIGVIQIDQAGTILRQFYMDLSGTNTNAAAAGTVNPRYRHITSTSQNEPVFRVQAGTVCNVRWVSITTTNATVSCNFVGPRQSYQSTTIQPGTL